MKKDWWKSRTIWAQVIGAAAMGLSLFGVTVIDAATQEAVVTAVWTFVNLYLRFKTDQPIA